MLCWRDHCISWRYVALLFFAVAGIFLLYFGIRIESDADLALEELRKEETKDDISNASV